MLRMLVSILAKQNFFCTCFTPLGINIILSFLVSSYFASEFVIEDKVHEMVKDVDYTAAPLVSEDWISMKSVFSISEI